MKKFFALFLSLMMLFSVGQAEEMSNYLLSPEEIAVEGNYMLLEDYGLMMFIPADFISFEVTEEAAATQGTLAIMGREDASLMMTIAFAGIADAEGNIITNYEDLAAFYTASGTAVEHCAINYLESMFYSIPAEMVSNGMLTNGVCIQSSIEGAWLNICVLGATEADMEVGSLILLSLMPQAQSAE